MAAQAVSGSVDAASRSFINQEYQQLVAEIDAIGGQSEFNGAALIDGTYNENFLVGLNAADVINVDLTGIIIDSTDPTNLGDGVTSLSATLVDTSANATIALDILDSSFDGVSGARANIGASISRFEYRGEYIESAVDNLSSAKSTIMDVDIASEQTNLTAKQVLTEAAIASLAQANQSKASLLSLLR